MYVESSLNKLSSLSPVSRTESTRFARAIGIFSNRESCFALYVGASSSDANSPLERIGISGFPSNDLRGYTPVGSRNPVPITSPSPDTPAIEPIMIGNCACFPSIKNPTTHEPSISPVGDVPIPLNAAEVIGCNG